jgi:hypothetical protein
VPLKPASDAHALFAKCSCAASLGRGTGEAAHGVALPPGAAGGFYLGLAVPATAGDGDGTRADADAAEGRDAEQEQVGTGGRQAARRRAGRAARTWRRLGAAPAVADTHLTFSYSYSKSRLAVACATSGDFQRGCTSQQGADGEGRKGITAHT